MIFIQRLTLSLGILLLANCATAADQQTIKVRAEAWETYSADGQGYLFELVSAAFEPFGYTIEFSFCPWKRCIQDVIKGDADIIVGVYDDESFIGETIKVNQHAVLHERVGVAFLKSTSNNWQGQASLKNQTTASLRGLNYHHELKVPINLIEVSNNHQEWQLLSSQRVKYILSDAFTLETFRKKYQSETRQFQIEPVFTKAAYLGFSGTEKGDQLRNIFDNYYPTLYSSGFIHKLQAKHQIPLSYFQQ